MMIRHIESLRMGIIDPQTLICKETSRRAGNLQLSKHRDVENVHSAGVNTLDVDSEGRYLLSGCSDGSIYVHNLLNFTGSPCFTANAEEVIGRNHRSVHQYSVECVQWYPHDSGFFISGSMDKHLKVWDCNSMRPVDVLVFEGRIFQTHMSPIAFSKCIVAVAGSESKVRLVDLNTGSCSHELRGHESAVLTCRWSPREEHMLVTGGCDGQILLWDARSTNTSLKVLEEKNIPQNSKRPQKKIRSHEGSVNGLCFTRNGHHLISMGTDSKVKLWNMNTMSKENVDFGTIRTEIRRCIQFDVSEYAKPELMYIPCDGMILVFDIHSGRKVQSLSGHYNLVNSCKFSSEYQELYSGANDRSVLIWTADQLQSEAYDDHMRNQNSTGKEVRGSSHKIPSELATQDAWSSDESD